MGTEFGRHGQATLRTIAGILMVGTLCHLGGPAAWAQDGKWLLEGKGFRLAYDEAGGRAVLMRAGGEALVGHIAFDGDFAGKVGKARAVCGKLGELPCLAIRRGNGTLDEIMASPELPFALFRRTLRNTSSEPNNIRALPLLSCEASWAADGRNLKTMGTGGLLGVEENPGSYMWLAVAEPVNRRGLVCGWLTSHRGGGAVLSSRVNGVAKISAHINYGRLIVPAGKEEASEVLALGWFDDARLGMEAWADAVAKVNDIHLPPQPVGYCSWNDGHESINERQVADRAAQAALHLKPFGFSVMQIDDGWQRGMAGWVGNPKGPFPSGMKAMADRIKSYGLVPGLWFCPFSANGADKNLTSDPANPGWYAPGLDLTNPKAVEHFKSVIKRISQEYGYSYFKMDAFSIGLIDDGYDNQGWLNPRAFAYQEPNEAYWKKGVWRKVHNPLMTPFEAHRVGLKAVREVAGKDAFLLGCNLAQSMSLYGASMGAVDAMRIGMDNNLSFYPENLDEALARIVDKKDNQIAHILHGPIAGSRNYHLNRRVWYNDPDQAGDNIPLLSWTALSDSLWMVGQKLDFGDKPGESPVADRLAKTIPNHGKTNRPVDLFECPLARVWIVTDGEGENRRDVVGFFNWNPDGAGVTIEESFKRLDMPEGLQYVAYDFWENRLVGTFDKSVKVEVAPRSCSVFALRAWREHPMVISTSRHITQGMIDVSGENWDSATRTLSGTSKVVGGFPYELRIYAPAGACGKVTEVVVAEDDRTAGAAASIAGEGDVVRVKVDSKSTREVRWSVRFGQ